VVILQWGLSWLRRAGVVAGAAMWLALPADAAVYTGIWDPPYGAPFDGLGWRGSAGFFVPDSCKPTGTADVSNSGACDGQAAVTSGLVEFYDINDTAQPTLATLVFDPDTLLIDTLRYVNGALVELTTSLADFVSPQADLTRFGVSPSTQFALQFTFDGPALAWAQCDGPACQIGGFNDGAQFPPRFVITEVTSVPEPATLGLVGLALAGLAAGQYRRRRVVGQR
jgi:hypothetical protein